MVDTSDLWRGQWRNDDPRTPSSPRRCAVHEQGSKRQRRPNSKPPPPRRPAPAPSTTTSIPKESLLRRRRRQPRPPPAMHDIRSLFRLPGDLRTGSPARRYLLHPRRRDQLLQIARPHPNERRHALDKATQPSSTAQYRTCRLLTGCAPHQPNNAATMPPSWSNALLGERSTRTLFHSTGADLPTRDTSPSGPRCSPPDPDCSRCFQSGKACQCRSQSSPTPLERSRFSDRCSSYCGGLPDA